MISEEGIRKQAERRYPDFLRSLVTGAPFFPLEIRFGKLPPKGNYHAFSKKRAALLEEAANVVAGGAGDANPAESRDGYIVELEERRSRRYGVQLLPRRIYFGDEDGYARFLGREREVERYRAAVETTR
ncbi:MAG: DUF3322 domain-containing protein, partial [Rhodothermales bacterium]